MKIHLLPPITLLFLPVLFIACAPEDDDDAITPDEGLSLEGAYLMNDYNVHLYSSASVDTSYLVVSKPKVVFETNKQTGTGKIRIDLRDFIEETVNEYYRTSPVKVSLAVENVNPDEMIAEKVSVGTFEVKKFDFDGVFTTETDTTTYPWNFKAEGTFYEDKISFHFIITVDTGIQSNFEGTAEGKRFNEL